MTLLEVIRQPFITDKSKEVAAYWASSMEHLLIFVIV